MSVAPVIYIFFNRPEITRRSFSVIRKARPSRLFLISDGPRAQRPDDAERCRQARAIVEEMIDWPCEVTRDYATENMGCGRRLSSGLTHAFAQLGEGIVLEDDILPHPDFFPFCTEQLARHRSNPKIHSIGGFSPLGRYSPADGATVPTLHNSIWGWASWQRSWSDYRFDLSLWNDPAVRDRLRAFCQDDLLFQHYAQGFDKTASGELDTWDYQWTFCMMLQQRHAVVSSTNLVENIGFIHDSTHTHTIEPWLKGLRAHPVFRAKKERTVDQPDRTHDRLYNLVVMTDSLWKIRLARAAARWPAFRPLLAR